MSRTIRLLERHTLQLPKGSVALISCASDARQWWPGQDLFEATQSLGRAQWRTHSGRSCRWLQKTRVVYSRATIVKGFLNRLLVKLGVRPAPKPPAPQQPKIDWKAKATEAMDRAKSSEAEARQHAKRVEKLQAAIEKLQRRDVEFKKMEEQLAALERELTVAREHLMVVEVKLDILEGAANVLDARTRTATRPQARETGAAV